MVRARPVTLLARRRLRIVLLAAAAVAATLVLVIGAVNAYVVTSVPGATSNIARLPHAQVALVPGALVQPDGRMSAMLADRVTQALALWRAGKVDRILVSGDHGTWRYDEPDTMRDALLADGVPGRDIFTDDAGFDTWATMVRARKVFQVHTAIVVTQGFHMPRALFLAQHAGLHAWGLTADLHNYGSQEQRSAVRELLARVKAVGQVALDTKVILGPEIPITGDGRSSWGPTSPPAHAHA